MKKQCFRSRTPHEPGLPELPVAESITLYTIHAPYTYRSLEGGNEAEHQHDEAKEHEHQGGQAQQPAPLGYVELRRDENQNGREDEETNRQADRETDRETDR